MEEQSESSVKRPYNRVPAEVSPFLLQKKEELFNEVFENKMKITRAARKIGLNISTAKFLVKQYKKTHGMGIKKEAFGGKVQASTASSEEENQPETHRNNPPNNYFPLYYPFYPQGFYPWTSGDGQLLFNTFYPSA